MTVIKMRIPVTPRGYLLRNVMSIWSSWEHFIYKLSCSSRLQFRVEFHPNRHGSSRTAAPLPPPPPSRSVCMIEAFEGS